MTIQREGGRQCGWVRYTILGDPAAGSPAGLQAHATQPGWMPR